MLNIIKVHLSFSLRTQHMKVNLSLSLSLSLSAQDNRRTHVMIKVHFSLLFGAQHNESASCTAMFGRKIGVGGISSVRFVIPNPMQHTQHIRTRLLVF